MATRENIRELAEPLLAASGLELWDVEVSRDVVRILIDRPGGVDLDALSQASVALSPLFDQRDDVAPAGHYQLEVSSPGVERTLRTPEQYRRYVDSVLAVKTSTAVDGARRFQGTLASVADDHITLVTDSGSAGEASLALRFDQIARAHTVLVWGPKPKGAGPGRPQRPRAEPGRPQRPRAEGGGARVRREQKNARNAKDVRDLKDAAS
jgi:ribosome maturation factor RimP